MSEQKDRRENRLDGDNEAERDTCWGTDPGAPPSLPEFSSPSSQIALK